VFIIEQGEPKPVLQLSRKDITGAQIAMNETGGMHATDKCTQFREQLPPQQQLFFTSLRQCPAEPMIDTVSGVCDGEEILPTAWKLPPEYIMWCVDSYLQQRVRVNAGAGSPAAFDLGLQHCCRAARSILFVINLLLTIHRDAAERRAAYPVPVVGQVILRQLPGPLA